MKKIIISAIIGISLLSGTSLMANAKKGQKFYLKKLKVCKKDGLKNGAVFATKHSRKEWENLKKENSLQKEWLNICSHGEKKINKMKEKDIKNLYDFVWKFASDGEVPSCG